MAMRSVFSGCISFGLVSIPVKAYTATQSKAVKFNMLTPAGNRVKQQLVDAVTGELVERSATVKGYEHTKGEYVTLTDAEIKSLAAEGDKVIEVLQFVPLGQVDPVYFSGSYMVGPDDGGAMSYALLRRVMETSGKVAIARYISRGKENLAVLRPTPQGLMMHNLHYADEVRSFVDLEIHNVEIKDEELALASQLLSNLSEETFNPEQFTDEYRERVQGAIQSKLDGKEIVAPESKTVSDFSNLVASLKASLGE